MSDQTQFAEPKLPDDPEYYSQVVANVRRYQRVVWQVPEEAITIYFGQSTGIKGLRNNYLFVCTDGRRQPFLGSNHMEDKRDNYEPGNLTRGYSVAEVVTIWLALRRKRDSIA